MLLIFCAASIVAFEYFGPKASQDIQGDVLGQGEANYSGNEPAFSLKQFQPPASITAAAEAVERAPRVNAVVTTDGQTYPVPEPTGNETRADVFSRTIGREKISAVILYADGEVREALGVEETLPPDAVWGRFAVRVES